MLLLATGLLAAQADAATEQTEPLPQRGGTFFPSPERVDLEYLPLGPNRPTTQAGGQGDVLSLRLSVELPLRSRQPLADGRGTQGSQRRSPTAQLGLRLVPWAGQPLFVQTTIFRYLQPSAQQAWNPDFSYSFGYQDTFSLVYANYAGNRLNPNRSAGEQRFNFSQGQWSAGSQFALPETLAQILLTGDGDSALCNANLNLVPRYSDLASSSDKNNKRFATLGCRYTRADGWYAHLTVFDWPDRNQRQPWDPDFTYGLGYIGWFDGRLALQYDNYSGNRWRVRNRASGQGSLLDGSLMLSWSIQWP